ncbi:MAG: hypothetical protein GF421_13695 [Candidatus Aminicenantes bacterium]|nr:hypothetical protein [Candidatus Aminicenantes bacterium]
MKNEKFFLLKKEKLNAPGETIVLDIHFLSKVPRPVSRTGVYKNNDFIAQLFPKIGVFQ